MLEFRSELPRLVSLIFDSAESPAGLEPALARIADLLRADAAHAIGIHSSGQIDSHCYGADRSLFLEYERNWKDTDPRMAAAALAMNRVLSDVDVIDPHTFDRSALYNELLVKSDHRYTLFTHTAIAPDHLLAQAFLRTREQGPFGAEHVSALTELMPYLRRAMQLRYLVGLARDELQDLRRTLDAMPGAVAVLHGDGSVLCSNAAAERLFAAGDGVRVEAKKLSTVRAREAQKLAATIRATAVLAEGVLDPAESPRVVHIRRDRARPLGVVFAPLWASNALRLGDPRARVLAAFHDPDAALTLDPALIAELHGFTEVEALLASALVRGLTLAEFAHERSCSEHTVRTHLKRVLEKSGARRQSDLVRVLLGSSALHLGSSR